MEENALSEEETALTEVEETRSRRLQSPGLVSPFRRADHLPQAAAALAVDLADMQTTTQLRRDWGFALLRPRALG